MHNSEQTIFDLRSAIEAKRSECLESWIQEYLRSGEWANLGLADGLLLAHRWWRGPIKMRLSSLSRCCGPESDMQFQTSLKHWENKLNLLQTSFTSEESFPPIIAECFEGRSIIRDGSHRFEAFRRLGLQSIWVIFWYNSEDEYNTAEQGAAANPYPLRS